MCTRKKFNLCLSAERDVFFCLILIKGYIERNDFKADDKLVKRHFYCTIAFSHRGKKNRERARGGGVLGGEGGETPPLATFPNTNLRKNR